MAIERDNYPGIPGDFPIEPAFAAIGGAQPKINLMQENGTFYAPGTSPSEVARAFDLCDDLVPQIAAYCERKLEAFGGDRAATLRAVYQGLLNKRWCTAEQSKWVMRQTVQKMGWPLVDELLPKP
jgi:hypothetical protein